MVQDTHFQRMMNQVKEDVLKMGSMVEAAIHRSAQALVEMNPEECRTVIRGDKAVDRMENEIDHECITLMATQQPVANDLRLLTSVFNISTILERMGDQAVNVAQRALKVNFCNDVTAPDDLVLMARIALEMTSDCLDAFLRVDMGLAGGVLRRDDELDELKRTFLDDMVEWMSQDKANVVPGIQFVLASRHLERIGDLATNIAEEVFFLAKGQLIRHGGKKQSAN